MVDGKACVAGSFLSWECFLMEEGELLSEGCWGQAEARSPPAASGLEMELPRPPQTCVLHPGHPEQRGHLQHLGQQLGSAHSPALHQPGPAEP